MSSYSLLSIALFFASFSFSAAYKFRGNDMACVESKAPATFMGDSYESAAECSASCVAFDFFYTTGSVRNQMSCFCQHECAHFVEKFGSVLYSNMASVMNTFCHVIYCFTFFLCFLKLISLFFFTEQSSSSFSVHRCTDHGTHPVGHRCPYGCAHSSPYRSSN
jgi:hypothetical protein